MQEFIVAILDSALDYNNISKIIIVYILSLWLMISLWLFFDAKRRFSSLPLAIILFLAVLIFNFPALIFYIIVRPEDDGRVIHGHHEINGGLNIPVANFINQQGDIQFSLNIKLNSAQVNNDSIKVNIEAHKDILVEQPVRNLSSENKALSTKKITSGEKLSDKLKKRASDLKNKSLKASKNLLMSIKSYGDKIDEKSDIKENEEKK